MVPDPTDAGACELPICWMCGWRGARRERCRIGQDLLGHGFCIILTEVCPGREGEGEKGRQRKGLSARSDDDRVCSC